MPRLTVMTYNIAQAVGVDNAEDLPRIAAVIGAAGADVVALQEVAADEQAGEQGARLAAILGMHLALGTKLGVWHTGPGHPDRPYGLAILSRYPIVSVHRQVLPPSHDDRRELLQAGLHIAGRTLTFATTHPSATSPQRRAVQLAAAHTLLSAISGPLIAAGDFNDTPDAPTIAPFAATFTDAGGGPTFPAEKPADRIDYIFAGPGIRTARAHVPDTDASDHRPLVARLTLPPATP